MQLTRHQCAGYLAQSCRVNRVFRNIAGGLRQFIIRHVVPLQIARQPIAPIPATGQQHIVVLRQAREKPAHDDVTPTVGDNVDNRLRLEPVVAANLSIKCPLECPFCEN